MPPKNKTEKSIDAELKKKTTAEAKSILASLKSEASKSGDAKKASRKKLEKPTTESKSRSHAVAKAQRVSDRNSNNDSKKLAKATVSSTDTVTDPIDMFTADMTFMAVPSKENASNLRENSQGKVDRNLASKLASSTDIDADSIHLSTADMASNSKKSKVHASKSKSKIGEYHFEIDCKRVADSIDVKDLKLFLERQLKVDGKKDNLKNTVSIHCEGQKAIINSNVYMPKKSLRFLSKKFLKKNWNIQVVSKNVHSYEYKYVGTL